MKHETVAIIDFGGENNQVIARLVRGMQVYCKVFNTKGIEEKLEKANPKAVIFAGKADAAAVGVVGVDCPVLDLTNREPDVAEIRAFLFDTCKLSADWTTEDFINEAVAQLRATIGDGKTLLALSGGVDSTVCAALINKAIGKNLTCVFVDTGLMRLDEGDEVVSMFKEKFDMDITRVDAEARFLAKLKGVEDPEHKRKIIGEEFIRVFEEEAKKIGAVDFLAQGTIYPDIIESGTDSSAVVKSHHNVGGLPDVIDFKAIVEPVLELFKDEVRQVGLALGVPAGMVNRQPFPGPGLGVRCLGEVNKEKLDILRQADFIFRDEIAKAGLDKSIWQYFAVLMNVKTVGVRNHARAYGHTIALRAVNTVDAMTAEWVKVPYEVLEKVSERITDEVLEISRVVYDVTGKPPGTIEWE